MGENSMKSFICAVALAAAAYAGANQVATRGEEILLDGEPIKILGLRCSNALASDEATEELIESLALYNVYGINTVSIFIMGSRFGDVKGYLPDGSLNPIIRERLKRVLVETDRRRMVTIVGCLYWGTSAAKEALSHWTQADADRAIANTAGWLRSEGFTHVILDPDNEGMAVREKKWKTEGFIQAAKAAYPELLVANNTSQRTEGEDINMHFGKPKAGKPWFDSESTPKETPLSAYWYAYSKQTNDGERDYANYSRIGRYTEEMKKNQIDLSIDFIANHSGVVLASTWLQCGSGEGVGGPFSRPGGRSELGSSDDLGGDWNRRIDLLHPDAGILWWLEFVKERYGPWNPN